MAESAEQGVLDADEHHMVNRVLRLGDRSVDSVMTQARSRLPPVILPEPFDLEEGRVICYPGDVRHSVRALAMPGPTRLYFHARHKRFEPVNGFDSLFD